MRLAIICQGRTFLTDKSESLQLTLTPSVELINKSLATHGWYAKVMQPRSQKDYEEQIENLKDSLSSTRNIEFLLYYIGHGKSTENKEYELCFEEHDLPVNKIIDWTRKLFNYPPRYISLVLDCCYSGDAIKDMAKNYDIELLTSTNKDSKTYEIEINNVMVSEFANSFCSALESINDKESISLEDIAGHIGGESFYSPSNPNPTDKLTIGYAKDKLAIRKMLLKHDFNTLRYASLHYIDKNAILRDKIVQADTIAELIDEIFKNRQCLFCLLQELNIHTDYFNGESYSCQKLKDDRKVASILVILESETKEKLEDMEFEMSIYYQYEDAIDYEPLDKVTTKFDGIGEHLGNAYKAKNNKNQVEFIFMVPNEVFIDSEGTNKLSKLELNTGSLGSDDILDIGNISYKILMRYEYLEEFKSPWEENSEHFITCINSNIEEYCHSDDATAFNHEAKILQKTTTKFTNKMLEMHIKRGICASLYDTNSINLDDIKVQGMKKHIFKHLKKHKESFFICDRYDKEVIKRYKESQQTNVNNNTTEGENYVHI